MQKFSGRIATQQNLNGVINKPKTVVDCNYELLENKPRINGVALEGDKSFDDLGLLFDGETIVKENGLITVADDSHGHTVENVKGLSEALDRAEAHASNNENPHGVTKSQLGLGNVENKSSATIRGELTKSDVTGALGYTPPTAGDVETALAVKADKTALQSVDSSLTAHKADKNNPHGVTKSQIGLGNVENKSSADIRGELTKSDVTGALGYTPPTTNTTYGAATGSANGLMSAADKKKLDGIAAGAQVNSITGVKGGAESSYRTGQVNITAANIGLGNVENKSSATIRGELTKANVVSALGYTPSSDGAAETISSSVRRQQRPSDLFKIF